MSNPARAIFEQQVLPLFEQTRAEYLILARATARLLAHTNGSVTINDVREKCPPPAGIDGRVMGAVFLKAEFEQLGYETSDRRTSHGRPVARFRLRVAA